MTRDHVVQLSSIDHCMPRAYVRTCLAFTVGPQQDVHEQIQKLNSFVKRTVHAVPYLAGYVVPSKQSDGRTDAQEIHVSDVDVANYPDIVTSYRLRDAIASEYPTYAILKEKRLPPSVIKPDLVSDLRTDIDGDHEPVFRVQANPLDGGLIVAVYVHHCVTDGTGFGKLMSGDLLHSAASLDCSPDPNDSPAHDHYVSHVCNTLLANSAREESEQRSRLSRGHDSDYRTKRHLVEARELRSSTDSKAPPGQGCVFSFATAKLEALKRDMTQFLNSSIHNCKPPFISLHDVLQTVLWHHMTKARMGSLKPEHYIIKSDLFIPVNLRSKINPPLTDAFLGCAVDSARASLPLVHLAQSGPNALAHTALSIRAAIAQVNDDFIRECITLANTSADVKDLLATNMSRGIGADMYITSWEKLGLYDSNLGMDLGGPDWVRKPHSRDPGACIVLPKHKHRDFYEVVVQLRSEDMERLLVDNEFMGLVEHTIE